MPVRTRAPSPEGRAPSRLGGSPLSALLLSLAVMGADAYEAGGPAAWEQAPPPEARSLEAGGERFPALFSPARTEESQGTVVVVPGPGAGPDAQGVVRALRGGIPGYGWDTLSLAPPAIRGDLPVEHQSLAARGVARIRAAVGTLGGDGPVVVAGHGAGALMAAAYVGDGAPDRVVGLVALNPRPAGETPSAAASRLGTVTVPLMLVVGSRASPDVLELVAVFRALPAPGAGFRDVEIPGADQWFWNAEQIVLERTRGWLRGIPRKPAPDLVEE